MSTILVSDMGEDRPRRMSPSIRVLGLGVFAAIVTCALSLTVGGWAWPTVTVLIFVAWRVLSLVLPMGGLRKVNLSDSVESSADPENS
jgi:fatty acid desaturase